MTIRVFSELFLILRLRIATVRSALTLERNSWAAFYIETVSDFETTSTRFRNKKQQLEPLLNRKTGSSDIKRD